MVPCCHVDLLVLAAVQCSTCNLAQRVSGSERRAGLEGVCTGPGRRDGVDGVWVVVALTGLPVWSPQRLAVARLPWSGERSPSW